MYFDLRLPAGAAVTVPTPATHNAFLYVYEGAAAVGEDARPLPFRAAGLLTPGESVRRGVGSSLYTERPLGANPPALRLCKRKLRIRAAAEMGLRGKAPHHLLAQQQFR